MSTSNRDSTGTEPIGCHFWYAVSSFLFLPLVRCPEKWSRNFINRQIDNLFRKDRIIVAQQKEEANNVVRDKYREKRGWRLIETIVDLYGTSVLFPCIVDVCETLLLETCTRRRKGEEFRKMMKRNGGKKGEKNVLTLWEKLTINNHKFVDIILSWCIISCKKQTEQC